MHRQVAHSVSNALCCCFSYHALFDLQYESSASKDHCCHKGASPWEMGISVMRGRKMPGCMVLFLDEYAQDGSQAGSTTHTSCKECLCNAESHWAKGVWPWSPARLTKSLCPSGTHEYGGSQLFTLSGYRAAQRGDHHLISLEVYQLKRAPMGQVWCATGDGHGRRSTKQILASLKEHTSSIGGVPLSQRKNLGMRSLWCQWPSRSIDPQSEFPMPEHRWPVRPFSEYAAGIAHEEASEE